MYCQSKHVLSVQTRIVSPNMYSLSKHVLSFQTRIVSPKTYCQSKHVLSVQTGIVSPNMYSLSKHVLSIQTYIVSPKMYCQSKHLLSVQTRIVSPNMIQKQAKCKQKMINPFPNKPWFLRVYSMSLLKTLWEKEKLLVMSNFSFSNSVLYHFGKYSATFIKFKIVVRRLFEYGRV